jgi:hypothetical protein
MWLIHQLSETASPWHGQILIFFALLSPLGLVAFSLAMTQVNFLLPFISSISLCFLLSLFLRVFFFWGVGGGLVGGDVQELYQELFFISEMISRMLIERLTYR